MQTVQIIFGNGNSYQINDYIVEKSESGSLFLVDIKFRKN